MIGRHGIHRNPVSQQLSCHADGPRPVAFDVPLSVDELVDLCFVARGHWRLKGHVLVEARHGHGVTDLQPDVPGVREVGERVPRLPV